MFPSLRDVLSTCLNDELLLALWVPCLWNKSEVPIFRAALLDEATLPAQTAQEVTGLFGFPFHGRVGDFISRNGPLLAAILEPTPQNRCYLAEIGHGSSPFFASQSQDWCYLAELGHCSGPFCVTVGNDVHPVEQLSTLDRAVLASRSHGALGASTGLLAGASPWQPPLRAGPRMRLRRGGRGA